MHKSLSAQNGAPDWTGGIYKPTDLSWSLWGDTLTPGLPQDTLPPRGLGGSGRGRGGKAGLALPEILTISGVESPPCLSLGRSYRQLLQKAWVGPPRSVLLSLSPPLALQQTATQQAHQGPLGGLRHSWAGLPSKETLPGAHSFARDMPSGGGTETPRGQWPCSKESGNQEVPVRPQDCPCPHDECQDRLGATRSISSPSPH